MEERFQIYEEYHNIYKYIVRSYLLRLNANRLPKTKDRAERDRRRMGRNTLSTKVQTFADEAQKETAKDIVNKKPEELNYDVVTSNLRPLLKALQQEFLADKEFFGDLAPFGRLPVFQQGFRYGMKSVPYERRDEVDALVATYVSKRNDTTGNPLVTTDKVFQNDADAREDWDIVTKSLANLYNETITENLPPVAPLPPAAEAQADIRAMINNRPAPVRLALESGSELVATQQQPAMSSSAVATQQQGGTSSTSTPSIAPPPTTDTNAAPQRPLPPPPGTIPSSVAPVIPPVSSAAAAQPAQPPPLQQQPVTGAPTATTNTDITLLPRQLLRLLAREFLVQFPDAAYLGPNSNLSAFDQFYNAARQGKYPTVRQLVTNISAELIAMNDDSRGGPEARAAAEQRVRNLMNPRDVKVETVTDVSLKVRAYLIDETSIKNGIPKELFVPQDFNVWPNNDVDAELRRLLKLLLAVYLTPEEDAQLLVAMDVLATQLRENGANLMIAVPLPEQVVVDPTLPRAPQGNILPAFKPYIAPYREICRYLARSYAVAALRAEITDNTALYNNITDIARQAYDEYVTRGATGLAKDYTVSGALLEYNRIMGNLMAAANVPPQALPSWKFPYGSNAFVMTPEAQALVNHTVQSYNKQPLQGVAPLFTAGDRTVWPPDNVANAIQQFLNVFNKEALDGVANAINAPPQSAATPAQNTPTVVGEIAQLQRLFEEQQQRQLVAQLAEESRLSQVAAQEARRNNQPVQAALPGIRMQLRELYLYILQSYAVKLYTQREDVGQEQLIVSLVAAIANTIYRDWQELANEPTLDTQFSWPEFDIHLRRLTSTLDKMFILNRVNPPDFTKIYGTFDDEVAWRNSNQSALLFSEINDKWLTKGYLAAVTKENGASPNNPYSLTVFLAPLPKTQEELDLSQLYQNWSNQRLRQITLDRNAYWQAFVGERQKTFTDILRDVNKVYTFYASAALVKRTDVNDDFKNIVVSDISKLVNGKWLEFMNVLILRDEDSELALNMGRFLVSLNNRLAEIQIQPPEFNSDASVVDFFNSYTPEDQLRVGAAILAADAQNQVPMFNPQNTIDTWFTTLFWHLNFFLNTVKAEEDKFKRASVFEQVMMTGGDDFTTRPNDAADYGTTSNSAVLTNLSIRLANELVTKEQESLVPTGESDVVIEKADEIVETPAANGGLAAPTELAKKVFPDQLDVSASQADTTATGTEALLATTTITTGEEDVAKIAPGRVNLIGDTLPDRDLRKDVAVVDSTSTSVVGTTTTTTPLSSATSNTGTTTTFVTKPVPVPLEQLTRQIADLRAALDASVAEQQRVAADLAKVQEASANAKVVAATAVDPPTQIKAANDANALDVTELTMEQQLAALTAQVTALADQLKAAETAAVAPTATSTSIAIQTTPEPTVTPTMSRGIGTETLPPTVTDYLTKTGANGAPLLPINQTRLGGPTLLDYTTVWIITRSQGRYSESELRATIGTAAKDCKGLLATPASEFQDDFKEQFAEKIYDMILKSKALEDSVNTKSRDCTITIGDQALEVSVKDAGGGEAPVATLNSLGAVGATAAVGTAVYSKWGVIGLVGLVVLVLVLLLIWWLVERMLTAKKAAAAQQNQPKPNCPCPAGTRPA